MVINAETYEKVEQVLARFPQDWGKNYYRNKNDLVVVHEQKQEDWRFADYSHENNIITIFGDNYEAVSHELFHMAFRDREKVNKEFTSGTIFANGICFKNANDEKNLIGLLEGFTEYLARLCCNARGREIEFFFVDLLISIYGEEILEYCLKNDPEGFLMDDRFYEITHLGSNLDVFSHAADEIHITLHLRDAIEKAMQENVEARKLLLEMIHSNMRLFNSSIIGSFDSIITEFRACDNPRISKDALIDKLSLILTDPTYKVAFGFKDRGCDVGKSLQKSLDEFKRR